MSFEECEADFSLFLKALQFAAFKHRDQRRKGGKKRPYINHPIQLAEILWTTGHVRDTNTLVAALLHDTVEDTGVKPEEISELFGDDVRGLVMEVTDNKLLPKPVRKYLQIVDAPKKSLRAMQIKLADKISNVTEVAQDPPEDWSLDRRKEYLDWTEQVVNGLRGHHPELEARYDAALADARKLVEQQSHHK